MRGFNSDVSATVSRLVLIFYFASQLLPHRLPLNADYTRHTPQYFIPALKHYLMSDAPRHLRRLMRFCELSKQQQHLFVGELAPIFDENAP